MGVKSTERVSVPAAGIAPAAGVYANVPCTLAVAFNCVALNAVPAVIGAGVAQVIVGVVAAIAEERPKQFNSNTQIIKA